MLFTLQMTNTLTKNVKETLNQINKISETTEYAKKNSLKLIEVDGVKFDILKNEWILSKDESVNYITQFKKN